MSYSNPKLAYLENEQAYIEQRVMEASPIELTCILYEGAIDAIRDSVMFLAQGEVIARGRSISRAQAILMELAQSLSQEADVELSQRLRLLYEYSMRRLGEAHQSQNETVLLEVKALLENLLDAWRQISPKRPEAEVQAHRIAEHGVGEHGVGEYGSGEYGSGEYGEEREALLA